MQSRSLFSLIFEQAERELGERIGYPALVYEYDPPPVDIPDEPYPPTEGGPEPPEW